MTKKSYFLLSAASILLIALSLLSNTALAGGVMPSAAGFSSPLQQVASPTPIPLEPPTLPPERVLPPVGSNAWLLLGVSVLVLIIIGGVVWSARWGKKH